VAATDGVAGHHGDDGLGKAADLHLEVEDVEAADAARVLVAVVPAHLLAAAGAEGLPALPGEDDDAHLGIVAGEVEGAGQL